MAVLVPDAPWIDGQTYTVGAPASDGSGGDVTTTFTASSTVSAPVAPSGFAASYKRIVHNEPPFGDSCYDGVPETHSHSAVISVSAVGAGTAALVTATNLSLQDGTAAALVSSTEPLLVRMTAEDQCIEVSLVDTLGQVVASETLCSPDTCADSDFRPNFFTEYIIPGGSQCGGADSGCAASGPGPWGLPAWAMLLGFVLVRYRRREPDDVG